VIKAAILEDELEYQKTMTEYFARFCQETGTAFHVDCFSDGNKFLSEYKDDYDVVFIDVQLENSDGFETAKALRKLNGDVIIIFVTSLAHFALKGYEVAAFDFIVKPLTYEIYKLKMSRVFDKLKSAKGVIIINYAGGFMQLSLSDVKYVETNGHAVLFHTVSGVYKSYASMKNIEKQINSPTFFRCNSCYLVNLKYVRGVNDFDLIIEGGVLQISRSRKAKLIETLNRYLGGSL